MSTLMEIRRKLDESSIDKRVQFFLAELYERQEAMAQELDQCASIMLGMAETIKTFVVLHESTQGKLQELSRRGLMDGVDVRSTPIEDDPTEN